LRGRSRIDFPIRNPEEVLEIGLSGGSWAWVTASHTALKRLTVIEINPGYLDLVGNYVEHKSILSNPKIRYVIDDGRRWLKRHPEARFDFILMNTTFHWRSNITNLLSREFLEICRNRLKEGGVFYFNTTGSEDSILTVARVFKHVTTYGNFVAGSDRPFAMTREERRRNLLRFQMDDRIIRERPDGAMLNALEDLAAVDLHDQAEEIRARADLQAITEDTMLPEFKRTSGRYGRWYRWYEPSRGWKNFTW
jgi:SAM-dependent methyltransferase